MSIEDELRELRELRARQAEERKRYQERAAEAFREKLLQRREDFRNGIFRPWCGCDDCARAILAMDPSKVCKNSFGEIWWYCPGFSDPENPAKYPHES